MSQNVLLFLQSVSVRAYSLNAPVQTALINKFMYFTKCNKLSLASLLDFKQIYRR